MIYLKDFEKFVKQGVAYLPLGTVEWHGRHLPLETDFLVAQKICELLAKKVPGYILPPVYLNTDYFDLAGGEELRGVERYEKIRKKLPGNIYWLEPELLSDLVASLMENLKREGFKKIFIVAGHSGSQVVETLSRLVKKERGEYFINPYSKTQIKVHHADEYETSLFWACYPAQEAKSRRIKIPAAEDCFNFYGRDLRKKASLRIGRRMLKEIIENCLKEIKAYEK